MIHREEFNELVNEFRVESVNKQHMLEAMVADVWHSRLKLDVLNSQNNGNVLRSVYDRDTGKRSVFVLGTHDWGNIGDLAIGYCEVTYLREIFPDYPVFCISRLTLLANWQRVKSSIQDGDIIVIHGGGNMGDIWFGEEMTRRKIIESFPLNHIISFPQSIKFNDNAELKKSAQIYNSHKNLLLAVRDDNSYKIAAKYFSNAKVVRTEDIVMYYEYQPSSDIRDDKVLYVVRNDIEKRDVPALETIHRAIDETYTVAATDTVVGDLSYAGEEAAAAHIYQKVDEIGKARLVITDRLHGAIFALHAGRPVVVVDNIYGKIRGALKNMSAKLGDRILFVDDVANNVTSEVVEKMYRMADVEERPKDLLSDEFAHFTGELIRFVGNR